MGLRCWQRFRFLTQSNRVYTESTYFRGFNRKVWEESEVGVIKVTVSWQIALALFALLAVKSFLCYSSVMAFRLIKPRRARRTQSWGYNVVLNHRERRDYTEFWECDGVSLN